MRQIQIDLSLMYVLHSVALLPLYLYLHLLFFPLPCIKNYWLSSTINIIITNTLLDT